MDKTLLLNVFIFLAAASLIVPLASRFKLGAVLGYLLVGILIGPFGLKLIANTQQIMSFGEFGVIMMLFLIGLELEPSKLWTLRRQILGLGGLQVLLTTCVLTGAGLMFGYSWRPTVAISMALSLSSTALVLQMLQERNLLKTPPGEASFSVLLLQDIAVIPILIIMPLLNPDGPVLSSQEELSYVAHLPKVLHALLIMGAIGGIILAGHYLSRYFFFMIAKTHIPEVFTALSLSVVIGTTLLMETIGVSPALGAFIAGVVLAGSQYKHTVEADIQPFKGLLLGLFFISVGMGINFQLLSEHALLIAGIVFGLIILKASVLFCLGLGFNLTKLQTIGFALVLSQGGEFAFVLFKYAFELKVISEQLREIMTLVVALSILSTPFLMLLYRHYVIPQFMSMIPKRANYDKIEANNDIILAGYGRFGQVIGRLLSGENIKVTVLEKNPDQIELLRKYGYKGYYGDANRLDLLKSAGAANAKLLIVAIGNPDTNLEIVQLAKREFPQLKIFARARNRRHAFELHKAGVDFFIRELFDASLSMLKEILKFLEYHELDVEKKTRAFQTHDEGILHKSFAFFDQEEKLITLSREAKGELERLLQEQ